MKRNKFNLSHYKIGSADMGNLYPISCFEVLPGDTVQMHTSVFLRFAPMVAPVMHPIKVSTYSFFVPYRLLWDDFEDFITGGPDGLDTTVPPQIDLQHSATGVTTGSLADYLGVPVGYTGKFSMLPIRAYYRIWNEYFRDQDLQSESTPGTQTTSGVYTPAANAGATVTGGFGLYSVSWEKDYFTTARPWPSKGATVTIPVNSAGSSGATISGNGKVSLSETLNSLNDIHIQQKSLTGTDLHGSIAPSAADPVFKDLIVNGSQFSINAGSQGLGNVRLDDLREAFALQRFTEHRAMYGSRYTEYLRYLGVRARDSRLQRPEYLGGGKSTIQLSEVLQTAADGSNPVGTLRGHGIGVNRSRTFRRYIEENGLIMTLMTIRPIAIYMNGLHKMWSREVKEDYFQRELQHIGQQEVLEKELYATGDTTSTVNDNSVFGYQNRYDDYRSVPSSVSGEMRNLLDYWHLARSFANAPVLNASFLDSHPTKRIFAEQTQNEIYFMASHSVVARRILSKQGNPIL